MKCLITALLFLDFINFYMYLASDILTWALSISMMIIEFLIPTMDDEYPRTS